MAYGLLWWVGGSAGTDLGPAAAGMLYAARGAARFYDAKMAMICGAPVGFRKYDGQEFYRIVNETPEFYHTNLMYIR